MTIKDIARESGYAVSTVSRALNDHPDVSPEAKARIQEIVQKHGFVPNANARQLKVQQSSGVLILVKGAFNTFFAGILERVQTAVSDAGYGVEVHYLDEMADELLVAAQLQREHKPLGIVFLGGNVHVFLKRFGAIRVPSVLATTVSPELHFPNLSCVGVDDAAAGAQAYEYLRSHGHKAIGVIGGDLELSYISSLRYRGFCAAAEAAGAPHPADRYETSIFSMEHGYRAMQNLMARHPELTAVFCMSDLLAAGAMRAVSDAGKRVPDDVSVLGFDGIELGRFCIPRLATIGQPQQAIAEQSVAQLLAQIERGATGETLVLPVTLAKGESVRSL